MDLINSKRLLYSASHVSVKLTDAEKRALDAKPGGAVGKVNLLRALNLDREALARVGAEVERQSPGMRAHMVKIMGAVTQLAEDPSAHLSVGEAIATVPAEAMLAVARSAALYAPADRKLQFISDLYELQTRIAPIGRLYLERLEMYPVGVEQGEMVFTVPMAPGESTTISHKEWSVSSRGYEDVVQDYFESYSERGVTEKTDAVTSSENEARQAKTLNFGASLTGSYGPVSLTTNLGFSSTSEERQSAKTSMQVNRDITQKSSARVRREHKVSMKIETKEGLSDSSFKTITNPAKTAVRIDYYKMMRKWRTDLFRYGLRMTYDITVPTPGVRLWARWQRLAEIDKLLAVPFSFGWAPSAINEGWASTEGLKLGVLVDALPPLQINPPPVFDTTPYFGEDDAGEVRFGRVEFDVPAGYQILTSDLAVDMAVWADLPQFFVLLNASDGVRTGDHISSSLPQHAGMSGHVAVSYAYRGVSQAAIRATFVCIRQVTTFDAWQKAVWHQLHDAAAARYQEDLARLQSERELLWRGLVGKDTLSLRRLEREEMLRLVMLWLVGPDTTYANAPSWVEQTVDQMLASERSFLSGAAPTMPSPTFAAVDRGEWSKAVLFGDLVRFIHQAVEWENLLYMLYPYFWGAEGQGRDKLLFEHPDPEHRDFLRAGYCRLVVTIRPGFEEDFTRLVETGSLGGTYTSPYLSIAQEIANKARTNYAGIPPANPEKHARPLLYPQQRKTWDIMQVLVDAIEKYNLDTGDYPASLADLPGSPETKDAWGNLIVYSLPGSGNDYDLISLGSDNAQGGEDTAADISAGASASLMASWFDYTPTSGIDIVVNPKPDLIA